MGERYYLTGVQLGMLKAWTRLKQLKQIEELLNEIEKKQFTGST